MTNSNSDKSARYTKSIQRLMVVIWSDWSSLTIEWYISQESTCKYTVSLTQRWRDGCTLQSFGLVSLEDGYGQIVYTRLWVPGNNICLRQFKSILWWFNIKRNYNHFLTEWIHWYKQWWIDRLEWYHRVWHWPSE